MATKTRNFATPRVAAGVLFRDARGRVLLVKPTYKDGWEIPGGYVEVGESPRAAATREVREELGLDVQTADMLVLDWAPSDTEGDKLLIIFDGGELSQDQVNSLVLQRAELSAAEFVDPEQLLELLPPRLARRVVYANSDPTAPYIEHGAVPTVSV